MKKATIIFSVISSIFLAFYFVITIGMCFKPFRDGIYKILKVVPETQYNTSLENENNLNKDLETKVTQLNDLKKQKTELTNQLEDMKKTNGNQKEKIALLEGKIDTLNYQINDLEKQLSEISKNIGDSRITYIGKFNRLFMPGFDAEGNYTGHGGCSGQSHYNRIYDGNYCSNIMHAEFENLDTKLKQAIESTQYGITLEIVNTYEIEINKETTEWSQYEKTLYFFDTATSTVSYTLDGVSMTFDELVNGLAPEFNYSIDVNINYQTQFDDSNQTEMVSDLSVSIIVNKV